MRQWSSTAISPCNSGHRSMIACQTEKEKTYATMGVADRSEEYSGTHARQGIPAFNPTSASGNPKPTSAKPQGRINPRTHYCQEVGVSEDSVVHEWEDWANRVDGDGIHVEELASGNWCKAEAGLARVVYRRSPLSRTASDALSAQRAKMILKRHNRQEARLGWHSVT
ncbi:hypothetical protein BDZ89DRAFT_1043128 [Hymenopellis radicata]|nr:hypothetical protein BDZ89DRAFT_1043128 [Hymenopellis radicata]